ncbi:EpsG family protein [Vagococcus fluvialis]|uniref:EpsG family protein n=1 Tax=Vagococcus fluvialis TaxID=2738 RepID=UPI00289289BD|nr:EpsG family protein [Vagococcus fluvialis]MDT2782435.1 EpsG family protein [Vagococcus fluvialis]
MDKEKKIGNTIFYIFLLLLVWGILSLSTNNPDRKNYELVYEYLSITDNYFYPDFEKGFSFFMRIGSKLNLTYQQFLIFISTISTFLLHIFLKRETQNKNLVLIMFLFFPFFLEVVQIRNYLVLLLVINSIPFLVEKKVIKFILLILIASLFHVSALFYLLFLLCYIEQKKLLYIVSLSTLSIVLFQNQILSILVSILPNGEKYLVYNNSTSISTVIMFVLFFMVNYYLINELSSSVYKIDKRYNFLSDYQKKSLDYTLKINTVIIFSFILITIDMNFFRIFRNIVIINYTLFANTIYNNKVLKNQHSLIIQVFFVLFSLLIGLFFLYSTQFNPVVKTILDSIDFSAFWR